MNFKKNYRRLMSLCYRSLPRYLVDLIDFIRSYHQCFFQDLPIFVHVPKNAGTSISKALYGKQILHMKAIPLKKMIKVFRLSDKIVIGIYRDPIDRFISSCNFLASGGTPSVQMDFQDYYRNYDLTCLSSYIRMLHEVEHDDLDVVFQRQSEFLDMDFNIYALEEIEFLSEIGIQIAARLPRLNSGEKKFKKADLTEEEKSFIYQYYETDYLFLKKINNQWKGDYVDG